MNGDGQLRIQCAMVIYEFERSLGRYILESNTNIASVPVGREILNRIGRSIVGDLQETCSIIIENSYFAEVLQLAVEVAEGSSESAHAKRLMALCNALEVFDIRNAVSHPNRPFPHCYWYRCCALASDPAIDSLHLYDVSAALASAIAGDLKEPPEEWLNQPRWCVPTNLPTEFEHSSTGLIGRNRDVARFQKELRNARSPLVSIVARGGIGKTSLVLQVLADFCVSPEAPQLTDGVLFISLKQEKLTERGIETLNAPQTIAGVRDHLTASLNAMFGWDWPDFSAALRACDDRRIWLFVDNLETLLRDEPLVFDGLMDELPQNWKVIVTSRVPLDGAKNIPLPSLDDGGAMALARAYLAAKGAAALDAVTLQRIIDTCHSNPLAIRLTVDYYVAGRDINESLESSQVDVTEFSFSNLLETLSPAANEVLEALFVLEQPSRGRLCEALNLDVDTISAAIASLGKTSLITRETTDAGEVYALGTSIRELLRVQPRNLKVRASLLDWQRKSEAAVASALKLQAERGLSPLDPFFIPEGTPASTIALSRQVAGACAAESPLACAPLLTRVRQQIDNQGGSAFLYRLQAKLLLRLNDPRDAESALRFAIQQDSADPAAKLMLAALAMRANNHEEAETLCQVLIDAGWGNASEDVEHAVLRLWSIYLSALNFQEKLGTVYSLTQDWKVSGPLMATHGAARVSAYRRQADLEFRRGVAGHGRVWKLIGHGIDAAAFLLKRYGMSRTLAHELRKLCGDIAFYLRKPDLGKPSDPQADSIRRLIDDYLPELQRAGADESDLRLVAATLGIALPPKIGIAEIAPAVGESLQGATETLGAEGYTLVCVSNVPAADGFPSYVFAKDDDGQSYFLHSSAFENRNTHRWTHIGAGTRLAIKHEADTNGRRSRRATAIMYLG
ncbi:tetratricopeptide repeat protein [Burkholderia cenocepacia]|uniref:NB-ARC domain-containing protein n=1 Tax=Burkholderia cenocepacia (strain ATCC BAA-245 / DSM 16553 / LMG 16656 / NCTC 13227 / J2315 / CF5610) TaxID=216591 RepID=B4EPA7_BURCJ|nr:tetratricopeptide repeat protein [Burkholderia cenocepacia]EPZ85145.1 hypothetical protein BURCENK562V_C6940 [Burkholderia cenocepacia K56-2Valvano]KKI82250.1 hypothetical protein WQ49_08360 [Burkholderia cenocepacia]ONR51047.1 hypothetical protein A8E17_32610 [Burkholderia cenocepacia]ONS14338.1 hypothetical protein A8E21_12400 [Burkholderia cenocepacia]ONS21899.1 hypothetical protein A8E24_06595 [Burkholderia cenocepacia]